MVPVVGEGCGSKQVTLSMGQFTQEGPPGPGRSSYSWGSETQAGGALILALPLLSASQFSLTCAGCQERDSQ